MLDQKFWKKNFKVYDILNFAFSYLDLLDSIIVKAGIRDGDLILDAGCGTGNFELRLKQKYPNIKAKIVGVANSPDGLKVYKKKIKNADFLLADLTSRLPFRDNYFDKIISNNVLFTIEPSKRTDVLKELYRVLKPGGKIVIANVQYYWSPLSIYFYEIKENIKRKGVLKTMVLMIRTLIPVIKIIYYNKRILKEGYFGDWRFMDEGEQIRKLSKVGFKNISPDKKVYVGQAILNSADK